MCVFWWGNALPLFAQPFAWIGNDLIRAAHIIIIIIHSIQNPAAIQAHPLSLAVSPLHSTRGQTHGKKRIRRTHTQPNNQKGGAWSNFWKMFYFFLRILPIRWRCTNWRCLRAALSFFLSILSFAEFSPTKSGCGKSECAFGGRRFARYAHWQLNRMCVGIGAHEKPPNKNQNMYS